LLTEPKIKNASKAKRPMTVKWSLVFWFNDFIFLRSSG